MIGSFAPPAMRVIAIGIRVGDHCNAHASRQLVVASWQSFGLLSCVAVRRIEMSGPLHLDNAAATLWILREICNMYTPALLSYRVCLFWCKNVRIAWLAWILLGSCLDLDWILIGYLWDLDWILNGSRLDLDVILIGSCFDLDWILIGS